VGESRSGRAGWNLRMYVPPKACQGCVRLEGTKAEGRKKAAARGVVSFAALELPELSRGLQGAGYWSGGYD